jgi:two-component system response regulator (stage 0 sporulation protein F)
MKPKVLCVDDEPVNLMLFEANFKDKFNIFTALDGGEGLNILSNNKDIHVIFSDMKMPKMNGIEFIGNARNISPHGHFYIMTGYEVTDEIQSAIDKKFIRKYFKKPLNFNTISSEIERVMKQKNR